MWEWFAGGKDGWDSAGRIRRACVMRGEGEERLRREGGPWLEDQGWHEQGAHRRRRPGAWRVLGKEQPQGILKEAV